MPRLPDYTSLGERPTPQPETGTVGLRVGQEAAALGHMADTIGEIEARLTRARRHSDLTDALGRATEELGTKAIEYSRDQDFRTSPARFKADATAIGERFASGLQDRVVRDLFATEFKKLAVSKQLGMLTHAAKQEGDYNTGQLTSELDTYAKQLASSANDMEREALAGLAKVAIGERVAAGWITDAQGAELTKRFAQRADQAVAMQAINDNPEAAYKKFTTDSKWLPNLDPVTRENLQRGAEVRVQQMDAERRRARTEAQEAAYDDLVQKFYGGKLTPQQVLTSDASPSVKAHMMKEIERQSKGETAEDRRGVRDSLWSRIYLPYGNPNKLTDLTALREAVIKGDITPTTYQFLRNEMVNSETDEGRKLGPDIQRAAATGRRMLSQSFVAQIPGMEAVAEEAASRFEQDFLARVADYKKNNKDPRLLITPGTPDYVLAPAKVASFMPGPKGSMGGAVSAAVTQAAPKSKDGQIDKAQVIREAEAALAAGAPRAAVEERLKVLGVTLSAPSEGEPFKATTAPVYEPTPTPGIPFRAQTPEPYKPGLPPELGGPVAPGSSPAARRKREGR